ncbi:hypothetical protein PIB30_038729 [Stylosanthes scabra]|uniref:Uncharacterized protein n=1 Tax=Stylosanthes scabra TaxID=79078 RepID=A0ABU6SDZ4_9FABA|nr:hypothetical protein [Stylosanthes scabra]
MNGGPLRRGMAEPRPSLAHTGPSILRYNNHYAKQTPNDSNNAAIPLRRSRTLPPGSQSPRRPPTKATGLVLLAHYMCRFVEPVDVSTARSWLPLADCRGMGPATPLIAPSACSPRPPSILKL